ncbi:lysophospholipid acyltransferase family protein [Streptomyces sp. NPDC019531]|uniref:lysophospholipid acyltransferase family protein n=1 Tax=Streptomyces sp. NPDC019531 TaxID=3365062 RepID=UPI00384FBF1B
MSSPTENLPSVWRPSAPCTPEQCVADRVPSVGTLRRTIRLVAGIGVLTGGTTLIPVVRRLPSTLRDRLIRTWCRAIVAAFGLRRRTTDARGAPAEGGVLVVANHVSWLDIPLVAAVLPGRMVAKSEIASYPVLGRVASAGGGTFFVERDRLRALPVKVDEMAAALRSGSTVVVFPEGCTWCGKQHGRFRNAAFQAAIDARVPVQPVRIEYRLDGHGPTTVPAFVGQDTLAASLLRVVAARGLTAEVTLLDPIPASTHDDRSALARAARAAVVPPMPPGRHDLPAGAGHTCQESVRPIPS